MGKNLGTVYECHNEACSSGSRVDPGRFTGGIAAEQVNLLTGAPVESLVEGKDYGEGFCPTCGEKGVSTDEEHISVNGTDPYQDLHDEIQARVEDEDDSLTARGAQAALVVAVKDREQAEREAVVSDAISPDGDEDAG